MTSVNPILTSIRTLAEPSTWERSVALADDLLPKFMRQVKPNEISRVYFVGCGTSFYAGQVGRYFVEQVARVPGQAVQAYEFAAYAEPTLLGRDTLVVAVSTSGDTEAAANALGRARDAGARTLAVTATAGSLVTRVAESTVLTGGERDTPPAKTSSYVQSLVSLWMLAHYLAEPRGLSDPTASMTRRRVP
jgi:glucosamine--fructose-6-phosphate aminotransferase (isomerizing)